MALIRCPKCGKEISDRGQICPHCRTWLDEEYLEKKRQELFEEGERQYQQSFAYQRDMNQKQKEEKQAMLPACPLCNSKENVKRISTFNRSISVLFNGLASSKIGKQYECTHCKHLF